jgi:putative ABC transport system permease protein
LSCWARANGRSSLFGDLRGGARRGDVGPIALAGKAVPEAAVVVMIGATGGWFAARALVGWAGPSPLVTPGAFAWSIVGAVLAIVATPVAIAVVSGSRSGRLFDVRPTRARRMRYPPWELVPLIGAVLCWFLLARGVQTSTTARIAPR